MLNFAPFHVAALPEIVFGSGKIQQLAEIAARFGQKALLVTGKAAFRNSPYWPPLLDDLAAKGIEIRDIPIPDEPSPQLIDDTVAKFKDWGCDLVIAIGGGSPLDAAKAIAGLLPHGNSVLDHLEGVGKGLAYRGPALPWIAVPTTAGTGSEATKNAVLSERGPKGYKKSFRHDLLVAKVALIDPDLLATCPKAQIAANGMDAFTQLLESYVSLRASPFTDALALSGIEAFREGFWPAWEDHHPEAASGYGRIAYASLCSGITLAQAGLGSVHGLASPLGAFFPIPHGVVCGTLVAKATQVNIQALQQRAPEDRALARYAKVAELLLSQTFASPQVALEALVDLLEAWTKRLALPRLREYGMSQADIDTVVANSRGSSMKTNPLVLEDAEIAAILTARL